ncbi:MAG: hypothetical protein WC223_00570, partial [Bacteroidales bacterium]
MKKKPQTLQTTFACFITPLFFHRPEKKYIKAASNPKIHAIGIPHQIPVIPNCFDKKTDTGTRMSHKENKVMN